MISKNLMVAPALGSGGEVSNQNALMGEGELVSIFSFLNGLAADIALTSSMTQGGATTFDRVSDSEPDGATTRSFRRNRESTPLPRPI